MQKFEKSSKFYEETIIRCDILPFRRKQDTFKVI